MTNFLHPKLGAYTLIKNEAHWVGYCVMAARHAVSQFVYFDGNSDDGTVELLEYLRDKKGINITLVKNKDPKDLKDDYVRLFNECLGRLDTMFAMFLHPDMIVTAGDWKPHDGPLAYTVKIDSYAADPQGPLLKITEGRTDRWKNIMKKALGLHYHGHYGAGNEDTYFREITGDEYRMHSDMSMYPYGVGESGLTLAHYSDVRPYARRYGRMIAVLKNQHPNMAEMNYHEYAKVHPRVSFAPHKIYPGFRFEEVPPAAIPAVFTQHAEEFASVLGKRVEDVCYLPLSRKAQETAAHVG